MTSILGENNWLHVITATRLAVVKQVIKTEEELLEECREMGAKIGSQI